MCPRISNGLWSFKVYTRFALGSNAALKVRTQGLPCTMHGSPQLQPRSSREGAGFRFRPLKVDDPESFGCEAAEPIRMHSLETRPLLCLYWPRLEISLCGQELGTDSSDRGPGAATGLPPIDCAAWGPWKAFDDMRRTHIRARFWPAPLQKMLAAEAGPGAKPSHASLPLLQESRPMLESSLLSNGIELSSQRRTSQ